MTAEYVVTFDKRYVDEGVGTLDGLRRMSLEDAADLIAVAARIPKRGYIVKVES